MVLKAIKLDLELGNVKRVQYQSKGYLSIHRFIIDI